MLMIKETTPEFRHGQTTVGLTAVQIANYPAALVQGVLLRAPGANDTTPNTDEIWVGKAGVTAANGMAIAPGETMAVPVEDMSQLYAISTAGGQVLAWWGQ